MRIQVLKTLTELSMRVGKKMVAEYVMPLMEQMLEDPEDLVILENIKMSCQLLRTRLLQRQTSLSVLKSLIPFLLYPNTQIRLAVATYISILATLGHGPA